MNLKADKMQLDLGYKVEQPWCSRVVKFYNVSHLDVKGSKYIKMVFVLLFFVFLITNIVCKEGYLWFMLYVQFCTFIGLRAV